MRALVAILASAMICAACFAVIPVDNLTSGNGQPTDQPVDATSDTSVGTGSDANGAQDVASDVTPTVDGGTDATPATDAGILCNGSLVSDCASCPNKPVRCRACDNADPGPVFCAQLGATCRDISPDAKYGNGCPCSTPSNCPFPDEVCWLGQFCHTCGETQSNGAACKAGGTCNAATGTCN